ncbi:MAG: D-2-hydroxyacid dehydrogenase [Caldilineaceae bacterium]
MKLLVTTNYMNLQAQELAKEFPQVQFVMATTPEALLQEIVDADAAVGYVGQEAFLAAQKLRWIQSASAGVEWMRNAPALIESDVTVTNMKGAHASTIAEHAFGMLVFLARKFALLYEKQKAHEWVPFGQGIEYFGLAGLTMGVVGLGQIGRAIAKRAYAFDMEVLAVDLHPVEKPDYVAELGLLDKLPDLMRRADVVAIATPITPETRGMITPELLRSMKSSAYLLVMSRGGIVDEPTLVQMLQEGKLAGAGLDVTAVEPLPQDNPLWDAPNVIITPHCSPTSSQTAGNTKAILRENLKRFLAGESLLNVVDKKLGY